MANEVNFVAKINKATVEYFFNLRFFLIINWQFFSGGLITYLALHTMVFSLLKNQFTSLNIYEIGFLSF